MFLMARGYHSFTVSVRVATTRMEEHARNNSGVLGARLSPVPICPTPRLDFSLHRGLAPAIANGDDGRGAMSLARRTADAMDLGPVPALARAQGISIHFRSAPRQAARDRAERAGTPGDDRSCRQAVHARHGGSPGPGGDGGGLARSRRCDL